MGETGISTVGQDEEGYAAHLLHDRLEHELVALIVHAFLKWDIDRVVLASSHPHIPDSSGAREEVAVLVEADCHHPVCQVEGLLHAIPMVDINVHIQNPVETASIQTLVTHWSACSVQDTLLSGAICKQPRGSCNRPARGSEA